MIKLQPITTSDTRLYNFMEQLLIVSFPPEEYRPIDDLRALTDHSAQFRNNVLLDNGMPIGLLTYWDFGDYCYVEHFATSQELRNKGYGKQSLECLHNTLRRPIVLEVECPTNELAQRRINFYQRQGFALWDKEYFQPPYRDGEKKLPMLLMVSGALDADKDFERIKRTLHKEVYRYNDSCPQ